MEMHPVKSSQVVAVGYSPDTKKLRVTYKPFKADAPNPTYEYSDVTDEEHKAIVGSDSVGGAINFHIKRAGKPFVKLPQEEEPK